MRKECSNIQYSCRHQEFGRTISQGYRKRSTPLVKHRSGFYPGLLESLVLNQVAEWEGG